MLLTEKYRPLKTADFVGLEKAKKLCSKLVDNPFDSAWLFVGASGTGKTTIALALADELGAELHHIPSQNCTVDTVKQLRDKLAYAPMFGNGWHVVIVDEADEMSTQAENAWLSLTDSTNRPKNTIIIFTCNSTEKLKDRFLSRCGVIEFSSYGIAKGVIELLSAVWTRETNTPAPNFQRIVKESNNNIRAALMELQKELIFA